MSTKTPVTFCPVRADLYEGAHVRQFSNKQRTKVSGPSGEVLCFVSVERKGKTVYRALIAWRPEEGDHTEQFVDVDRLRLENTPPPPRKPYYEPTDRDEDGDVTICDCGGELKFDPNLVGDTCGGLTRIGWNVCVKCGKGWLSSKGHSVEGKWKLASGGRSVETGNGRIRVDGGTKVQELMARIVKLPELELEVAELRKYRDEQEALVKESETVPKPEVDGLGEPFDDEFRKLQRQVYDSLTTYSRRGEWDGKSVDQALGCLRMAEYEVDGEKRYWYVAAIQYASKYGRMA